MDVGATPQVSGTIVAMGVLWLIPCEGVTTTAELGRLV